jgi:hypothetical protein
MRVDFMSDVLNADATEVVTGLAPLAGDHMAYGLEDQGPQAETGVWPTPQPPTRVLPAPLNFSFPAVEEKLTPSTVAGRKRGDARA